MVTLTQGERMDRTLFRVGLSADFLNDQRQLALPDIGLSLLDAHPEVAYGFLTEDRPEYEPPQLMDLDALISLKPRVTAASLEGVERLAVIGRCGVGYDNVDLKACTERGIAVFITPEGVMRPMAESIVAFVLALSHDLVRKDRLMRGGNWAESTRKLGREPRGRTIGTIGFGNIAREAIRLLRVFDPARILVYDPFVTAESVAEAGADTASLDELLAASDYVLVNCPLTPTTRGLIGEAELRRMKPEAVLVNTARGPIVQEAILIQALRERWIAAAALDVFEREPLDLASPLLHLDNVILTSHSIGWTEELFRDMGRLDCEGVLAVSHGRVPPNVVNPEVLERPAFQRKLENFRRRHGA
jgi:phosphoglycerate dehydrogenase-like enzyme